MKEIRLSQYITNKIVRRISALNEDEDNKEWVHVSTASCIYIELIVLCYI